MRTALLASFILAAAVCSAQGFNDPVYAAPATGTVNNIHLDQRMGNQVPLDVDFADENGKAVKLGDCFRSRPVVLLPIFYRCKGVCGLELENLLYAIPKMKRKVGRDFDVVAISIDPQEGPVLAQGKKASVLASSPSMKGTDNGWHFLTGSLANIQKVTDSLGFFYHFDAATDTVDHPSGVMILTPFGIVSKYILTASFEPATVDKELDAANANTVGVKTNDTFFGCVHTDPVTGRKSIVIVRFLSIAGAVTVLGLAALVACLFRAAKNKGSGELTPTNEDASK